jgi:hypothetical protein
MATAEELRLKEMKRKRGAEGAMGMTPILAPPKPNMVGGMQVPEQTNYGVVRGPYQTGSPESGRTSEFRVGVDDNYGPDVVQKLRIAEMKAQAPQAPAASPQPAAPTQSAADPRDPSRLSPGAQAILEERTLRQLRNDKARLLMSSSRGDFANNGERIDAIRGTSDRLATLEDARRTPQAEMTPEKAAAARDQLRIQMLKMGQGYTDQAGSIYRGGDEKKMAEGDALAAEGGRLSRAAETSFPTLSPEEAAAQADRMNAARDRQKARIADSREVADFETGAQRADQARQRELGTLGYDNVASGIRASTAENEARAGQAKLSTDPEQIKIQQEIERLKAQSALASAKGELRDSTMSSSGLDERFYSTANTIEGRISGRVGTMWPFKNYVEAGHISGPDLTTDIQDLDVYASLIGRLERLAETDPVAASEEATMRLRALPPNPLKAAGGRVEDKRMFAAKVASIRERLGRIAQR